MHQSKLPCIQFLTLLGDSLSAQEYLYSEELVEKGREKLGKGRESSSTLFPVFLFLFIMTLQNEIKILKLEKCWPALVGSHITRKEADRTEARG